MNSYEMDKNKAWTYQELVMLEECYALAGQYGNQEVTKKFWEEKQAQIKNALENQTEHEVEFQRNHLTSYMQRVSDAIWKLAQEEPDLKSSLREPFNSEELRAMYTRMQQNVPDDLDGELAYLEAICTLKNERNKITCALAHGLMKHALTCTPDDPRYIALAQILQENT